MEAIVLAGGFGTRLRHIVPDVPKPMAPVDGRPFLEILLSLLARKGFARIVLSLGYMAEKISTHFGDRYRGVEILYEVEDQPLGTGGAIRAALGHCQADHVYVFNGDTYLDLEVEALEVRWMERRDPLMVVREVPDAARYGRVELLHGRVAAFREKGEVGPGMINAGCYVLPRSLLDAYAIGRNFSLETEFFATNLQTTWIEGFVTRGLFIDIGVPEDYSLAQTLLAGL